MEAPVFGSTLGKVNALLEDRNGNLWVGTDASGVFRVSADGGNLAFYSAEDGLNVRAAEHLGRLEYRGWAGRGSGPMTVTSQPTKS